MNIIFNELSTNILKLGFNIDSILFQSKDACVFWGKNNIVNIQSAAKTITSIAFGIAYSQYQLDLDEPIISFFPEYRKTAPLATENIKLIDLLHMQSGKKLQSLLSKPGEEDWLAWFFDAPIDCIPGTQFYYSSHCCYVIGRLIERLCGQDINDYLEKKLWDPLKIKKPIWSKCPQGYTICAGNLLMSCEDLSKIGNLLLNKGVYNGISICPTDYISLMTNSIVDSNDPFLWNDKECRNGYGFFIWKCSSPNTFCAWGAGGTFCVVDYKKECVITITAFKDDNWLRMNDHIILIEVFEFLSKIR